MPRKIAAGNWKMHGGMAALTELDSLAAGLAQDGPDVVICPPAPFLAAAATRSERVAIGAQDCHADASGAHTGDISAEMIAETGARYVIVGHSERRADHFETDADVARKVLAAQRAGLTAILCIGESYDARQEGRTLSVIDTQLKGSLPGAADPAQLVIAYEPVWAIGTGLTATPDQIAEVHDHIRAALGTERGDIPLLYGGSVKPANAAEIFAVPHVHGALVGGASLKANDFAPIVAALAAA